MILLTACDQEMQRAGAALQNAEARHHGVVLAEAIIETVGDDSFLVVTGESRNVVVLLNPRQPPYYMQLPHGERYLVSEEDVNKVGASEKVSSTVLNVLWSRLEEAKSDNPILVPGQ